jgi:hypothetical protein
MMSLPHGKEIAVYCRPAAGRSHGECVLRARVRLSYAVPPAVLENRMSATTRELYEFVTRLTCAALAPIAAA